MPTMPTRACERPLCKNHALPGGWLCADHKNTARKEYDRRRSTTAERRLYNGATWKNLRAAMLARNPMCQVIESNGVQCRYQAHAIHHLKHHDGNPALFFDWANLVAICDGHHTNTEGETANRNFVPTIGLGGESYPHPAMLPNGKPALGDGSAEPLFYSSGISQSEKPIAPEILKPAPAPPAAPDTSGPKLPPRTWAS